MPDAHRCALLLLAALASLPAYSTEPTAQVRVETQPVSELARPALLAAAAEVRPRNDSWLSAELSAVVRTVHADVGNSVAKGDTLLELDDRDARLALDQARAQRRAAEAELRLAEQRMQRGLELREKAHISADELLALDTGAAAAEARLDMARASERSAERALQKTRILAPYDGAVMARQAQVGQLAAAGTPLLRLVDSGPGEVIAALPAEWAESARTAPAIWFESQRGERYALAGLQLTTTIDSISRTQHARLQFADAAARTGSSGRILVETGAFELPAALVVERGGRRGIFLAEGAAARFQAVDSFVEGRSVRVRLPADTRVVVSGQQTLQDGQTLKIERTR